MIKTIPGRILMKRFLSLMLCLVLLVSIPVFTGTANAADSSGFKEGDEIYLDVSGYTSWTESSPVFYVNFTDEEKAPGTSIDIQSADKSKYDPKGGLVEVKSYVYKYVIQKSDEGKKILRFWRGSASQLWNYSVTLSSEQYTDGKNAVRVTGKNGEGDVFTYDGTDPVEETKVDDTPHAQVKAFRSNALFAHGTSGKGDDNEAWLIWSEQQGNMYFFLPSSLKSGDEIEIFNAFSSDAVLSISGKNITLKADEITKVKVNNRDTGKVTVNSKTYNCVFSFSSGECAVFANNTDRSQTGNTDLWSYLTADKEHYVSATAAVTADDGSIVLQDIKKLKGRGNTSWDNAGNPKYGFNITFSSAINLGTMESCKKFSLISNFQDASLCRNRFLYDLGDEVNITYASDSRFMDFYVNGEYKGAYMMAQKVDCGKNTLMSDIDEDDYLNYVSGEQDGFQMCLEIGGGGADADEIGFNANNNAVAVKYPGIGLDDENAGKVLEFAKAKFTELYNALRNSATTEQYVDIDSMAKMYLINEFSKNWDGGSSSVFFVYKKDSSGKWMWYASPVWDYDNSLGNANGVARSLQQWGVNDYNLPTGWFINKKDKSNLYKISYSNATVKQRMYKVWFEEFVPAIEKFTDKSGINTGELYSKDVYYGYLENQAYNNFFVSPMIVNTGWISDHSSLSAFSAKYSYDGDGFINGVQFVNNENKRYDQYSFSGEYDYMVDWARTRAAWISNEFIEGYNSQEHEKPTEPQTESQTETQPQPDPAPDIDDKNAIAFWSFDPDGKEAGAKLSEYGNADDGYQATKGSGLLTLSVDGEKMRALEWSDVEYGTAGLNMVPIMAAGSKNQWFLNGTPYIQLSQINASGYKDLKITMYLAGSNKAPANWKLTYSTDGENFKDVENASFSLSKDNRKILTAYLDKNALPKDADDKKDITLKLIVTDNTTVAGGSTDDSPTGGEVAINYIMVEGTKDGSGALRGDADLDGDITVSDATYIQQHLAKLRTLTGQAYDNAALDEGEVTVVVATRIQQYLAKLIDHV